MKRCKVNDICLIVRASRYPELLGLLCTVKAPSLFKNRDWAVEIPNHPAPITGLWEAYDDSLRPIKPHGGSDESLVWKRVPRPEESVRDILRELTGADE